MAKFNIIGTGFLDMEDGNVAAFKTKNPWFCFADVELGRSIEFSVPATDKNRKMLGFGDDPAEYGEMMRQWHNCQMVYDGGSMSGALAVNGYEGDAFKCTFILNGSAEIQKAIGQKLKDVPSIYISSLEIQWATTTPVKNCDTLLPADRIAIVNYDNGISSSPSWQLVPSVCLHNFVFDVIGDTLLPFFLISPIFKKYWLVAGSMNNGTTDNVTLEQVDTNHVNITQSQGILSPIYFDLEYATALVFGQYIGGSVTAQGFKVEADTKMTLGYVNTDIYLIKWNEKLKQCECLGGYPSNYDGGYLPGNAGKDLTGMTIDWKKGDIFFFADRDGDIISDNLWAGSQILTSTYFGWHNTASNVTVTATLTVTADMQLGDMWRLKYNMPDMTVFELLKSACLAAGKEMMINAKYGSYIMDAEYGQTPGAFTDTDFKELENVVSIDSVTRSAWGEGTAEADVKFDSDEYVTQPIVARYEVPNGTATEKKEFVAKFSEGEYGDNGVVIRDVEDLTYKFKAKKWTIAYADPLKKQLQRVPTPEQIGYADIAANSTCVKVKSLLPLAEFFDILPSTTWLWRGCAYIWTEATWNNGVLSMTMQRVSAMKADAKTPPPVVLSWITATFEQGGALIIGTDSLDDLKQYLTVKATYSNGETVTLSDSDYTLSGTLEAPSCTITAEYQGKTATFTVAVAYDAEVEYLQSSGTQYIDTMIQPNQDLSVEIKWKNETNQNSKYLFGSGTSISNCIRAYIGESAYWRFGGGNKSFNTIDTTERIAIMDKTKIIMNGVEYSYGGTVGTFSSSTTIKLFAGATAGSMISTRIYYFKVSQNGTLILDLIPVRVGTFGYMYDRVNGILFGNDGTGDFIVGNDVP